MVHVNRSVLGWKTECRAETTARIQRKNTDGEAFLVEGRARRSTGPRWQATCVEIEEGKADEEEEKCLRENEQQPKRCPSYEEEILGGVRVVQNRAVRVKK